MGQGVEKDVYDLGIKLRSRKLLHLLQYLVLAPGLLVDPLVREGVVDICHRDHAPENRDLLSLPALRPSVVPHLHRITGFDVHITGVAGSIPVFMVGQSNVGGYIVKNRLLGLEETGAAECVTLHDLILFVGEAAGFFENDIADGYLSHIMKHGSHSKDIPVSMQLSGRHVPFLSPSLVELGGKGSNPVNVRPGLLRVSQLRHADHPQKQLAGQLGPLQSHAGRCGIVIDVELILLTEGSHIALCVLRIDELNDSENLSHVGDQGKGEHGRRFVSPQLIVALVETEGRALADLIDIRKIEDLPGFGNVSADGFSVYFYGKDRIDDLLARGEVFLLCVVLGVAKDEGVTLLEIHRAGIGIGNFSGLVEYLLQQDVQILRSLQLRVQFDNLS